MQILGSVGGIGGTHSWNCESATISEALWSTVFFFVGGGGELKQFKHIIQFLQCRRPVLESELADHCFFVKELCFLFFIWIIFTYLSTSDWTSHTLNFSMYLSTICSLAQAGHYLHVACTQLPAITNF